jgi:light-regulated signal transduction histidine kinase (bacteriophytochrome)
MGKMTDQPPFPLSVRELVAEYATGTVFDVSECVREPIHLLGSVQSRGVLLALAEPDLTIEVASTNAASLLGAEPAALAGRPAAELLGAEQAARLRRAVPSGTDTAVVPVELGAGADARRLEVSVHRGDGLLICEFEPSSDDPFRFSSFYAGVRRALLRLEGAQSVAGLCQAAVRQIRAVTGYERVVAYRFDGDGPGEVIAEDVAQGWEPWLGLWFPASDVPPQARRLYLRNWIRVIADVDDEGAGLLPPLRPGTQRPLDLSGSVLRTVSGYHLEYLRNIGVRASMSVSLIKDGRLWGLIACHSGTSRWLRLDQRAACELVGIALSLQFEGLEARQRAAGQARARTVFRQVLDAAPASPASSAEYLVTKSALLRELVTADGVYVRVGDAWRALGMVPEPDTLPRLFARLPAAPAGQAWSTDRLADVLADADLADRCGGLLMIRLGPDGDVLAWFRGEVSVEVRWAADPGRPIVTGRHGRRLTPRGSSVVWHETARDRSRPWSAEEHGIAEEAYRALFEVVTHHAEAPGAPGAGPRKPRKPRRPSAASAAGPAGDAAGLGDVAATRLETIRKLTTRMDDLLDSLLAYSRRGHAGQPPAPVPMDDVLDDIEEILGPRLASEQVRLRRPAPLGTVSGDRIRLQEVLVNLVGDAIQQADQTPPRWIEVGVEDVVPPGAAEPARAVYVRDNGRGTGTDLTASRRIVERYGGCLWVTPAAGPGSTSYFTL